MFALERQRFLEIQREAQIISSIHIIETPSSTVFLEDRKYACRTVFSESVLLEKRVPNEQRDRDRPVVRLHRYNRGAFPD